MVLKSISRDRWVKTQRKVRWIAEYLRDTTKGGQACTDEVKLVDEFTQRKEDGTMEKQEDCPDGQIPFKQLERIGGFLV